MATKAAEAANKAAEPLARNFRIGGKQIYLPNHVIAFIRPRKMQQPNLATFRVPLQFNKLDMRDYLFHVYKVRVNAVRSFLKPLPPRVVDGTENELHRPRPVKYMIAELESPFVWPDPPAKDDREDFDYDHWKDIKDHRDVVMKIRQDLKKSKLLLPSEMKESDDRKKMADMAEAYLSGKEVWKNNTDLDEIWDPVVQGMQEKQAKTLWNSSRVGEKRKDGTPSRVQTGSAYDDSVIVEDDEPLAKPRGSGAKR